MKVYTHYGVEVVFQCLYGKSFKEILDSAEKNYTELPLLDKTIYKYSNDGKTQYAYIICPNVPEEYVEEVYITTQVPDDMNWDKLVKDINDQAGGKDPMQMPTRARILYDKAVKMACENPLDQPESFIDWSQPKEKDVELALVSLGYTKEELKKMQHYDVPELDE